MVKHRRGPWSQAEDNYLLQLVHSQGAHNWVRISQLIQSRSPKQCRERYHQNLKPSLNLEPITPEEGLLIERLVAEMGKRWAEIARRLHGRSDNAVKNWWNGGMNRRKRLDNRRAEGAPRQARSQYYRPEQRPRPQEQQQDQQQQQLPPPEVSVAHVDPPTSHYQYPVPHVPRVGRPPLHQPPPPLPMQSVPRRVVEPPLPSPSTFSCMSRADSIDGAPSLVSDGSSYASTHQSPSVSPSAGELPPLTAWQQAHHRPSAPFVHIDALGKNRSEEGVDLRSPYCASGKIPPQSYLQPHQPITTYPPRTIEATQPARSASSSSPNRVDAPQLPLPNFYTITAPEARSIGPPSPPRDTRMDLSTVMH